MKILNFSLLFFILFLTSKLVCQATINETSQWKQHWSFSPQNCDCYVNKDQLYQVDGDTLIGNQNYFKVLLTGIYTTISTTDYTKLTDYIHTYAPPIREENNAIYAFNTTKNEEYLLYDFNLDVGDSIKWAGCNSDTIASIDTIFFGNTPLQRFHIKMASSTFVEGIGSTRGLYNQTCSGFPQTIAYLQCYCQNGVCITFPTVYDPNPDCDSLITIIQDIKDSDFLINPNPFDNEIQIQSTIPIDKDATIYILNLTGDLMIKKRIQFNTFFESVNAASLPPGIYFVGIQNQELTSFKKMVKL